MAVVYSDINTRAQNPDEDKFLSEDAKAVFQSIWRLITTEELEIPYYRSYGCNLKRFLQYPLTESTADYIFEYVKKRVSEFETRGSVINAKAYADVSNNTIRMELYVKVNATGETGVLPDLNVAVNRNR